MPYSDLVNKIRKRLGSSHALLIFRAQCRDIPVTTWNSALLTAFK
jgi:hypothetical protein